MNAKEIVLVDKNTDSVCCDGGDNNLGHPAVYFTFNDKNEIIFMTRHPIPFNKSNKLKIFKTYRQTGVIAFTKKSLLKYSKLNQNYFEKYESIDMLRVLESGFKICSFKSKKRMIGLDTKSDYKELKKIL